MAGAGGHGDGSPSHERAVCASGAAVLAMSGATIHTLAGTDQPLPQVQGNAPSDHIQVFLGALAFKLIPPRGSLLPSPVVSSPLEKGLLFFIGLRFVHLRLSSRNCLWHNTVVSPLCFQRGQLPRPPPRRPSEGLGSDQRGPHGPPPHGGSSPCAWRASEARLLAQCWAESPRPCLRVRVLHFPAKQQHEGGASHH